jgi:run domain Beclin-1 interacting cysteine-rich containing protein
MGEFIKTCRNSGNLIDLLANRKYLLDNVHIYSSLDLVECKTFMAFIMSIMESYVTHITEKCETCKGKGFYCEICKNNELLFSFQVRKISKCPVCKSLYHLTCVKKQGFSWKCVKCARRDQLSQRKSNNSL